VVGGTLSSVPRQCYAEDTIRHLDVLHDGRTRNKMILQIDAGFHREEHGFRSALLCVVHNTLDRRNGAFCDEPIKRH
jgi:hypothetical protein